MSLYHQIYPLSNKLHILQYEATIDWNAQAKNKQPEMALGMFFGELQRIIKIDLPATPNLNLKGPQTLFYAIVKQCNAERSRGGGGSGSTNNLVGWRLLIWGLSSVLLAGFSTGANGSLLTKCHEYDCLPQRYHTFAKKFVT